MTLNNCNGITSRKIIVNKNIAHLDIVIGHRCTMLHITYIKQGHKYRNGHNPITYNNKKNVVDHFDGKDSYIYETK